MNKINLQNNLFICLEVLEHVENDINVIKKMCPKSEFIFSVPNYDSLGHVRLFNNENEIRERYNNFFRNI